MTEETSLNTPLKWGAIRNGSCSAWNLAGRRARTLDRIGAGARHGGRTLRWASLLTLALGAQVAVAADAPPRPAMLDRPAVFTVEAARGGTLLGLATAGSRLVAVGAGGHVILSDDGGASWRAARQVPTSATLTAVRFADARTGWAVGHLGVILQTQDGGETWARQLDGVQAAVLALQAVRAAQGPSGPANEAERVALKMVELGVGDGPNKPFLAIRVFDAQRVVVLGAFGMALETRDGGKHWQSVAPAFDNPRGGHFYGVAGAPDELVVVGEQGMLLKQASDGRLRRVEIPYAGTLFGVLRLADGWLAYGLRGTVLRSADGLRWEKVDSGLSSSAQAGAVLRNGTVVLGSEIGQLVVSRDGGRSFSALNVRVPPMADLLGDGEKVSLLLAGPRGVELLDLSARKELQ